jgi:hypothetical protein
MKNVATEQPVVFYYMTTKTAWTEGPIPEEPKSKKEPIIVFDMVTKRSWVYKPRSRKK